ncbi:MAG: OmpA family protein [Epsilonproteobacteria bacterium]|nr:OmpA family protein [Campylobacterota bacterium]
MKKFVGLSVVAISLFATTNLNLGIGGGRSGVTHSPMKNYDFLNIRVTKELPQNRFLRFELEKSTAIKIPGIDNDTSLTRVLANVEKDFPIQNSKLTPYIFLGAGYQWVKGPYDNAAVADAGMGAKIGFTKNFDMFVEARGLRDFHNNDNHIGFLGGFEYSFGSEKPQVKQPLPQPIVHKIVYKDSDLDGVPDNLDKCPNTPHGVKVNKYGCPIDSDHDGVPDYLDKCPNTPAGVKVDKFGCPIDSDHDGVPDYLDRCPNTPKGITVNKNGCPVSFNFDITFDCCSAKIKPQYMEKIKEFAEFLKENPAYKAEIQGYTDNTGSKTYNIVLSQKRAKAVYDALIKLGISKDRLSWAGYGPANPIAPNNTPEGREKNRRVVAKLYF